MAFASPEHFDWLAVKLADSLIEPWANNGHSYGYSGMGGPYCHSFIL